ncbi:PREDICTED: WAS/WASL-interacting protein family member 2-like [Ceratotherium simum simum]|uniref:WAS/WASL-interacting protein family member 2-like n=1 Tax=Ceratotherium simum simum TaxID=73337 RepID=A0ABM1DH10_CERSS|nr:PREDICTED: WAS/WASL-interacting protein family member 2-like [Ceratotherium simum simum]
MIRRLLDKLLWRQFPAALLTAGGKIENRLEARTPTTYPAGTRSSAPGSRGPSSRGAGSRPTGHTHFRRPSLPGPNSASRGRTVRVSAEPPRVQTDRARAPPTPRPPSGPTAQPAGSGVALEPPPDQREPLRAQPTPAGCQPGRTASNPTGPGMFARQRPKPAETASGDLGTHRKPDQCACANTHTGRSAHAQEDAGSPPARAHPREPDKYQDSISRESTRCQV